MLKICPKDCPKRGKRICHTMECPTWKKAVEQYKPILLHKEGEKK